MIVHSFKACGISSSPDDFLKQVIAIEFKNYYKIRTSPKSLATIYFQKATNIVVNLVARKLTTGV